ncbi:MAG: tRNA guanosine(34) transglycosylase Tgt [Candidatus Hydrogenedentota bacterium]|nr:MAG: tRNA guanosine(34) transglycosylase Tgt [Candidatus Hydrogenedentota bacterium]
MLETGFTLVRCVGRARFGRLVTRHGVVETPCFMPVGTVGNVKGLTWEEVAGAGARMVLANTYHLLLRPGPEILEACGGLHRFADFDLPLLTDSGGYQVMSLSPFRKITEEGVHFSSPLDGSRFLLTPEEALRIQNAIGSDVQMVLDVCPSASEGPVAQRRANELTLCWARRSLEQPRTEGTLRFAIVQGGFDAEMRRDAAQNISSLPFDGFAIGGLSVGEEERVMMEMIEAVEPCLPKEKPRYLMGVGKPSQILKAIARGVDLFDCVLPTRVARHGTLWTSRGLIRINRAEFSADIRPVDALCRCRTCRDYSRAFLRHLYRLGDPLYVRLASLHNLTYLLEILAEVRRYLSDGEEGWVDLLHRNRMIAP